MSDLFPESAENCRRFVCEVKELSETIDKLPDLLTRESLSFPLPPELRYVPKIRRMVRFYKATLQEVFNHFNLPKAAQTLLALQGPDFLLPPDQLSFLRG